MRKIKLFKPFVSWKSIFYTIKTLRSGQLAEGPVVKKFEALFAEKFKVQNVCSLNSGTSALELAYELADIKPGDEVITPVLTCTATNIPLVRRGAKIIFADISSDLNVSVEDVINKITEKTKAVVFVHFGGNNRGLKELIELCKEKNIKLIEDAAQVIGADFWGRGDYTCISLQAIKSLTSGDGGILICKNIDDHIKAKKLRWFGYDREAKQKLGDTDLTLAGYKYHMNDISASIGLGNLERIDKNIKHRKKLIERYSKHGISAYPWFAYIITDKRDSLRKYLSEFGIDSGMHHYRNDQYTIFGGRTSLPKMDEVEFKYLLLPLNDFVSEADVDFIAKKINEFNEIHKT